MPDSKFDPYYKWLGIPPKDQPANHYRLLGIDPYESDPEVIESAAHRQMVHVRSFALGPHGEQAQSLLNELAAARIALSDAQTKAEYDQGLRIEKAHQGPTTPISHDLVEERSAFQSSTSGAHRKFMQSRSFLLIGLGVLGVAVAVFALNSYRRSAFLADALDREDYVAALQVDPDNIEALAMKKAAVLQQALTNRDYETALTLEPGNAHALAMKRTADLQRSLTNGDYETALSLDPNHAQALAMKKLADLQQALTSGDYETAPSLEPNHAQALAMKKLADLQQALTSGDYETALSLDPNHAQALAMKMTADLQQALADGDYETALTLEPGNAQALAMKTAAENRRVPTDRNDATERSLDHLLPPSEILSLPPRRNSMGMEFKLIPIGTFRMGSDFGESDKKPRVTVTKQFELGVHEVTQEQYARVMGTNPSQFLGAQNPVDSVSWHDAVEFCRKLSALPEEKAAGYEYRLPTEAEWAYACRAGTTTRYSFGDSDSQLFKYGWCEANSDQSPHPVGKKKPNPWGLYDMHGNVWEWCHDWYGEFSDDNAIDPTGPVSGSLRVVRGGSWSKPAGYSQSTSRGRSSPNREVNNHGFRVVRVVAE